MCRKSRSTFLIPFADRSFYIFLRLEDNLREIQEAVTVSARVFPCPIVKAHVPRMIG